MNKKKTRISGDSQNIHSAGPYVSIYLYGVTLDLRPYMAKYRKARIEKRMSIRN